MTISLSVSKIVLFGTLPTGIMIYKGRIMNTLWHIQPTEFQIKFSKNHYNLQIVLLYFIQV